MSASFRPISRVLIANRGEIACRIARTLRATGRTTIAIYSDADAGAPHVAAADVALPIGPPPVSESYLDIERIVAAAVAADADAIHPGYGFLSENAEFAAACEAAGLIFIGPGVEAIALMG
ncbi:MAG: biotin carboxylase N-terminal domain-containing protein, partial [Pseudomonadota bacterium]